jgi:hypothetical protein
MKLTQGFKLLGYVPDALLKELKQSLTKNRASEQLIYR